MSSITEFLLARIAEDEIRIDALRESDRRPLLSAASTVNHPDRLWAECQAKREVLRLYEDWPVLVDTPPKFKACMEGGERLSDAITYRLTQEVAWLTTREYVKRFGSEPAPAPIVKALAAVYSDHDDYQEEWKP